MFLHARYGPTCGFLLSQLLLTQCVVAQDEDKFTSKQRISRIHDLARRDNTAIPALSQYLSDPDRDIRVEAVKAIVRIGTDASLAPLVTATHDSDAEVEIRATDGLTNYYLPGYVVKAGLTGSLSRGIRQMKTFFASRNDQVVDPDVVIRSDVGEALAAEIKSGASVDARSNAALAAGILRDRAAVPALEQVMHDKNSQLIFESLVAMQKIGDLSAGPAAASATHDLDDRVQATALETVGLLHGLPAAPDVRTALSTARDLRIRRAALEALAMLAIPGDRATFLQYLRDQDPELRAAALEGLGRIREPEDFPAMQAAYNEKDADWKVHLAAAFALVSEGKVDTSEFSPLVYLVENLDVRGRAPTSSAYLTEVVRREDARTALLPLVKDSTKDQKIALCSILASSRSDDVLPTLNALTKDIDSDVAFAASRALRIAQAKSKNPDSVRLPGS
jgi:HEAT repeat protein